MFLVCLAGGVLIPNAVGLATWALALMGTISPGMAISLAFWTGVSKGAGPSGFAIDLTVLSAVLLAAHCLVYLIVHKGRLRVGLWIWLVFLSGAWVAISCAFITRAPAQTAFSAGWRYALLTVPMSVCVYVLCQDSRTLRTAAWAACAFASVWAGATIRTLMTTGSSIATVGSVNYISSATVLALVFLYLLDLAIGKGSWARGIATVSLAPALYVLIRAPSRGVLLAIGLVTLGVLIPRSRSTRVSFRKLSLAAGIVAVGLAAYSWLARTSVDVLRLTLWTRESTAVSSRLDLWQYGWSNWASSPVLGAGIGMTETHFGLGLYPHGLPQQALFELGMIGCLVFFPMWASGLTAGIRTILDHLAARSPPQNAAVAVLAEWCLVVGFDCLFSSEIAASREFLLCLAALQAGYHGRLLNDRYSTVPGRADHARDRA